MDMLDTVGREPPLGDFARKQFDYFPLHTIQHARRWEKDAAADRLSRNHRGLLDST
jgi:hypothetical protein